MTPCRLIVDEPQDGPWNMAVDEALLDEAADRGAASLRFYQWRDATLSLGYFQAEAERCSHSASLSASVVRRLSGGGALVHDRELTYAICLPASHPLARQAPALYAAVHRALIETLSSWHVLAGLFAELPGDRRQPSASSEPFLCFSRRTDFDVVLPIDGREAREVKIAGSAQRRRRGAVLQHGSVLLASSTAAPELSGILEVAGLALSATDLTQAWAPMLARRLGLQLEKQALDERLRASATRFRDSKYGWMPWTRRR